MIAQEVKPTTSMLVTEGQDLSLSAETANNILPIDQIVIGQRFRKDFGDVRPLAQSIREIGLLHPVVIDSKKNLIAGYRRIKAVQTLGWTRIPVHIVDLKDLSKGEIHENQLRKDFTPSEWVAIKRALEPEVKAEAEQREKAGIKQPSSNLDVGRTDVKIGKVAGVGKDTLRKAEAVVEAAEKNPEKYGALLEKVDSCKISISHAHKIIKRNEQHSLPTTTQGLKEVKILQGDFEKISLTLQEDSVDCIITDLPYGREFLDLYEKLGRVANRLLKPNGSLLVMTGQSYLPDVFDLLRPHLKYNWTIAYLTPGGQSAQLWERKVNSFWKPVLWFVKGKYEGNWVGDVAKSAPNDNEKHLMEWQQSESGIADLVKRFTKPNDLILDPLMGSGTTGAVASRLGRRFIGIDIDPKMVEITKQRIGPKIDQERRSNADTDPFISFVEGDFSLRERSILETLGKRGPKSIPVKILTLQVLRDWIHRQPASYRGGTELD